MNKQLRSKKKQNRIIYVLQQTTTVAGSKEPDRASGLLDSDIASPAKYPTTENWHNINFRNRLRTQLEISIPIHKNPINV